MPLRIVLDTDMGSDVDDALCLTLALAAPELELVAVTHVSKDTNLRACVSKRLLELAKRPEIPVYAGRALPFSGPDRFVWFGHEGAHILQPGDAPRVEEEDAVEALLRLFREDDLELVAVGPLTNVAAALRKDRRLAKRIRRLTVMGGYLRRSGIEYNLCSDPEAAVRVLRAGIPTLLVPGDVTLQTWLRESDLNEIEACGSELHRALARAVRMWTPTMHAIFATEGALSPDNVAYLHDPLTLACVYDDSFCTFEEVSVEPAVVNGLLELREHRSPHSGTVPLRCATAVDADRFRAHFVARIKGLLPPEAA